MSNQVGDFFKWAFYELVCLFVIGFRGSGGLGWFKNPVSSQTDVHKVHKVHTVKSAVSLKWQVGFENEMKMTPFFAIIFVSPNLTVHYITGTCFFSRLPEFTESDILWYVLKL